MSRVVRLHGNRPKAGSEILAVRDISAAGRAVVNRGLEK